MREALWVCTVVAVGQAVGVTWARYSNVPPSAAWAAAGIVAVAAAAVSAFRKEG